MHGVIVVVALWGVVGLLGVAWRCLEVRYVLGWDRLLIVAIAEGHVLLGMEGALDLAVPIRPTRHSAGAVLRGDGLRMSGRVLEDSWSAEVLDGFAFEILQSDLSISVGVEHLGVHLDILRVGFVGCVVRRVRVLRYSYVSVRRDEIS